MMYEDEYLDTTKSLVEYLYAAAHFSEEEWRTVDTYWGEA
jgi:hypothetical protein